MTTVSWGQKALLLCRGLDGVEEGAFLQTGGEQGRCLGEQTLSLGFVEPCPPACEPTGRVRQLWEVMLGDSRTGPRPQAAPSSWSPEHRARQGLAPGEGGGWGQGRMCAGCLRPSLPPLPPGLSCFRKDVSRSLYLCFLWRLSQAQPWP